MKLLFGCILLALSGMTALAMALRVAVFGPDLVSFIMLGGFLFGGLFYTITSIIEQCSKRKAATN